MINKKEINKQEFQEDGLGYLPASHFDELSPQTVHALGNFKDFLVLTVSL